MRTQRHDNVWPAVAFIVGLVALVALIGVVAAHAHDDAAWIQVNTEYRDRSGVHCCGVGDCRQLEPGEIMRVPGGWVHLPTQTSLLDHERGVYMSERPEPFICVRGAIKCLFPTAGT